MTATIARRLATLEARYPPPHSPGPPLDLSRLTEGERHDVETIAARASRDATGPLDLEALTDDDLERVAATLRKAWGATPCPRRP